MRASINARTTKSTRGDESGVGGRKDSRGSTWWTAGPGSGGSSSGNGRTVKVILSSCLLQMQQPKLCSDLTFQKHRLIQLLLLCFPTSPPPPPPPASSHLFSFISRSYSCHIFSQLPIYFFPSHSRSTPVSDSPPVTLPCISWWQRSFIPSLLTLDVVERSAQLIVPALNPPRSQSFSPLPEQTLKLIKELILLLLLLLLFGVEVDNSR